MIVGPVTQTCVLLFASLSLPHVHQYRPLTTAHWPLHPGVIWSEDGVARTVAILSAKAPSQSVAVPAARLARGTFYYRGELGPSSDAAPIATELTIRDADDGVHVAETVQLPGGRNASEEMVLDSNSLVVRKRLIQFGDRTIDLRFGQGGVRGTLQTKGGATAIEFPLAQELFGDGGGAFAVLGALPLVPGTAHTFYNLDLTNRRASRHHASIGVIEPVEVEAGAFDAFRIDVNADPPSEQASLRIWIDVKTRMLVKVHSANTRYELVRRH